MVTCTSPSAECGAPQAAQNRADPGRLLPQCEQKGIESGDFSAPGTAWNRVNGYSARKNRHTERLVSGCTIFNIGHPSSIRRTHLPDS